MTSRHVLGTAAVLLAIAATSVAAEEITRDVRAGGSVRLLHHSFFGADCRVTHLPTFSIVKEAQLGRVETKVESLPIANVASDDLRNCLGKKLQSAALYYKAGKVAGTDRFVVSRTTMNGGARNLDIVVNVR